MPTQIDTPDFFIKALRRLIRKYPDLLAEFDALKAQLQNDERPGDQIPHVGYEVYKVRLKNPSAQRGKSGGFRVIYYVRVVDKIIMLMVYSKMERENVPAQEIRAVVEEILGDSDDDEE